MSLKKVVQVRGFWKSVALMGVGFLVLYNLIDMTFSYALSFSVFYRQKIAPAPFRFIVANAVGGFLYGFIIAFLQFRRKLQQHKN